MYIYESRDRTEQLKREFVMIAFDEAVYDKIVRLMKLAREHVSKLDPVLYELDEARLDELNKLLGLPLSKDKAIRVQLSHLDLFDLESISYLAEGFPQDFGGDAALKMSFKDLAALTDMLEGYRKKAFAESYEDMA